MAGPNAKPTPTAIRAPTLDLDNHQIVLTQLKETTETAQRLRGNTDNSYVTLGELIKAGIVKFIGGVVSPASKGGGLSTVNVTDSITGDGSSGSPLQLSGDNASPGNNMVYGTNGSGVKGWYTGGGGGSLSVTDGTTTVAGTTTLTFSGATVSGISPNAIVTVSGGGGVGLPATIPDLCFWFQADTYNMGSGKPLNMIANTTPWSQDSAYPASGGITGVTRSSAQLNSKNTFDWPGNGSGRYNLSQGILLKTATIFLVMKQPASGQNSNFISGATNSLQLNTNPANDELALVKTNVIIIGATTFAIPIGSWFSVCATYDDSTGSYAFQIGGVPAGSGTNLQSISSLSSAIGYNAATNAEDGAASLGEEAIYNRVLSAPEIASLFAYSLAKWGV